MTKSTLIFFLINALASQNTQAMPSKTVWKQLSSVKEVCDITKNLGHFHHKGRLVLEDDVYKVSCGRVNLSSTGSVERSSLEIKVMGNDPKQWERIKLTLSTDLPDPHANAAFREAAYLLIGGETRDHSQKAQAFNMAYGPKFFENISAGDYAFSMPMLDSQYHGTIMHEYNARGGDRVTLELKYNTSVK